MESKSSGAEDPNLARLRYAGIIKAYGVSKLENDSIIEIIPFTLSLVAPPPPLPYFANPSDSRAPS
jgi:hypothetical protein